MIRFWTFVVGLALIVIAGRNMNAGGYDTREFQLMIALIVLLAVAVTVEFLGSWVDQMYADRKDDRETDLAMLENERDTEAEPVTEEEIAKARAVADQRDHHEPPFQYAKTTSVAWKDPHPGDLPPKTAIREDKIDPEGKAADHG